MAIDFPASPSTNDTHTHNGLTWKYDGTTWVLQATTNNNTFTGLSDTPSSMGSSGYYIKVNAAGTALEFTTAPTDTNTFTGLTGTPSSFTANRSVVINSAGTALVYAPASVDLKTTWNIPL